MTSQTTTTAILAPEATPKSDPMSFLAKMFANACEPETDHETIDTRYGTRIAIYATVNQSLFRMQRKYRELFTGPLAQHIQCRGVMAPLLVFGVHLEPSTQCTTDPTKYYADIFAADTSPITVREAADDAASNAIMEPVQRIFSTLRFKPSVPPPVGSRAVVSREQFMTRFETMLKMRDGTPDVALRAIFANAGRTERRGSSKEDVSSHGGSADGDLEALTQSRSNYCIAGGFISKMIDPCTSPSDFANSDVDIFVYGDRHEETIDAIVEKLFVYGETFITVRGSVVTIYRTNAMKVQIVSSSCGSPCQVISEFDLANVMAYWSNDTVFANANCLRAFATRVCKFRRTAEFRSDIRIVKLVRSGFRIGANKNETRRARLMDLVANYERLWTGVLGYLSYVHLDNSMPTSERIARIIHHDGVLDVITNIERPSLAKSAQDDPPARISQLMLLKRKISGYSASSMCDVEWQMVDVRKFPKTIGAQDSIQVAGFRARTTLATIGKIKMNGGREGRNVYILTPESSKMLIEMIELINKKLQTAGLGKFSAPITVDENIVKVVVECIPRKPGAEATHRESTNIFTSLHVKYESAKNYQLVLTTII